MQWRRKLETDSWSATIIEVNSSQIVIATLLFVLSAVFYNRNLHDERIDKVRVVTKRASLRNSFLQEEVEVVIAESTDDVMIINVSYNINVQL